MTASNPQSLDVWIAYASALLQDKQYSAAASAYSHVETQVVAQRRPVPLDLRMDWATALMQAKDMKGAAAVLQRGEGWQASAPALRMVADAEEAQGEYKDAVTHYEQAARLDPSEPLILAYGNELLQHRTFVPAIEILKYGTEKFPESARMRLALGAAYYNNGMPDKAAPEFFGLLERSPQDALAAEMLGRSCSSPEAASLSACTGMVSFAQQHPENAVASMYAAIAILQGENGTANQAEAQRLLLNAVMKDASLSHAWYQLAVLVQARNEWEKSAGYLQKALVLQPAFPEAHYRLARAYGHLGRREDAEKEAALQVKYADQEKDENSRRVMQVVKFLTTNP